jgi:arylsulfatase B
MTTELDYGLGNLTAALRAAGMWDNTVLILVSDNGGPLGHSNNFPLRGGKGSLWEGGVRVEAFVSSPLIPQSRWGTNWDGLAHSSDWYVTIVEGLAGGSAANSGPRPTDGHNLWLGITGDNETSPRTAVIHRVQNRCVRTRTQASAVVCLFRQVLLQVPSSPVGT